MDVLLKVWAFLNGKKTFLVALVAGVPVVAQYVHDLWCSFGGGACPVGAEKVLVVAASIVAVGHKIFKLLGWAESPEGK